MARQSAAKTKASNREGNQRMSARGLRQIYSQKLHPELEQRLDLLMFLREAEYRARSAKGENLPKPTRDELWDEALREFFDVFEKVSNYRFPAPPKIGTRRSFWVDFKYSRRVDDLARRERINASRIVDAAMSDYLSRRIGPTIHESMVQIAKYASAALKTGEKSAAQVIADLIETQHRVK
jgi:predicted transcriptional regulator